jgi:hypothetical protein
VTAVVQSALPVIPSPSGPFTMAQKKTSRSHGILTAGNLIDIAAETDFGRRRGPWPVG